MSEYDQAVLHLGYNPEELTEEEKVRLIEESQRRLAAVKVMPDSSLTPVQMSALSLVRAVANHRVYAADIPPASDRVKTAGMYSRSSQDIYISPVQLERGREAINTVIHELAHHTSGAEDGDSEHVAEIARVAEQVVESTKRGQYDQYLGGELSWN